MFVQYGYGIEALMFHTKTLTPASHNLLLCECVDGDNFDIYCLETNQKKINK